VTGTVKWFDDSKGYGFIIPDAPEEGAVFVHRTQIAGEGYMTLAQGDRVEFETQPQKEKGPRAVDVIVIADAPPQPTEGWRGRDRQHNR